MRTLFAVAVVVSLGWVPAPARADAPPSLGEIAAREKNKKKGKPITEEDLRNRRTRRHRIAAERRGRKRDRHSRQPGSGRRRREEGKGRARRRSRTTEEEYVRGRADGVAREADRGPVRRDQLDG